MKKLFYLLWTLCLPSVVSAQTFESVPDGFKVAFPAQPEEEAQQLETIWGMVPLRMYVYAPVDEIALMVGVTTYPPEHIHSDSLSKRDSLLRESVDNGVRSVEGAIVSERSIMLDGFPGKEFEAVAEKTGAHLVARYILAKNKMYMVQGVDVSGKPDMGKLRQFVASFSLVGQ